jgi:hypothetical protein
MKDRKFTFVTAILLLLLIAAVANLFFVNHIYNQSVTSVTSGTTGNSIYQNQPLVSPPALPRTSDAYFDWNASLSIDQSAAGGYDLVVAVTARQTEAPAPADSVEIDIRRAGADGVEITPEIKQDSVGKYIAHADFPANGEWEVRVRIHRFLQTMEFTKKFTVK